MKKTILLSTIIAASVGFAAEFECSNTFGVMPVTIARQYTLVSVPFVGYGTTSSSEVGIKVSELIKTSNLSVGDKIYASNGSSYDGWEIVASGDNKVWDPIAKIQISDLEVLSEMTTDADAAALSRGDAFWLVRANASSDAFYLMGEQPANSGTNVTVNAGTQHLLAYSSQSSGLNLKTWNCGANYDMIIVPKAGGAESTYIRKGDNWCTVSIDSTTHATTYVALTEDTVIPAGTGFIYKASPTGDPRTLSL